MTEMEILCERYEKAVAEAERLRSQVAHLEAENRALAFRLRARALAEAEAAAEKGGTS